MTALDFAGMFDEYVGSQTKEWKYDRSKTFGASEAFGCIRKSFFAKNGAKQDPDYVDNWGAKHRGDLIENHLVVPAVLHGMKVQDPKATLLGAGNAQTTIMAKNGLNTATPDGLIVGLERDALQKYGIPDIESDSIVLEIKSIDPRVALRDAKAIHTGQCQQQLGIIRQKTKYKPVYAVIVYVDASFHDNIKVFTIKFSPKRWKAAQERAKLLFNTKEAGHLRPEGKFDDSCKHCPFKQACAEATIGNIPPKATKADRDVMKPTVDEDLRGLVAEHEALRDIMDDAKAVYEQKRQEIKEHLTATRKRGEKADSWSVSWYSQSGKKKLNKEKLEEDNPGLKLDDYMEEGAGFDKLVVSTKDDF